MVNQLSRSLKSINRKTRTPIALKTDSEWVSQSDYIEWIYTDTDNQKSIEIKIENAVIGGTDPDSYTATTSEHRVLISNLLLSDGVYLWRIKALGSEAIYESEYSNPQYIRIDNVSPKLDAVDVVGIVGGVEYHSNYNRYDISKDNLISDPILSNGIYISNDEDRNVCRIRVINKNSTKDRFPVSKYNFRIYVPNIEDKIDIDKYKDSVIFEDNDSDDTSDIINII